MVKTTITVIVDAEIKAKVMNVIRNEMNTTLSKVINDRLWEIVKEYDLQPEVFA
jgi:hypothetical protein